VCEVILACRSLHVSDVLDTRLPIAAGRDAHLGVEPGSMDQSGGSRPIAAVESCCLVTGQLHSNVWGGAMSIVRYTKAIPSLRVHRATLAQRATDLVRGDFAFWLVEKFAYREIDQVGSAVESSVVTRRHNDQLPVRQGSVYLGVLFDRGKVMVASHD